jgi:Aldehyde oxidase and xanthine dehydrogenase, a/b hammerhead domain
MTTDLGSGVDRVDGPAKVRGAAAYPTDVTYPDLAHAALVRSTIASGRVTEIDAADARAAAGVLTVITHQTAPKLTPAPFGLLGLAPPPPLQDDRIHYHGQYVAVVVAATPHEAAAAARLVKVDYEPGDPLLTDFDDPARSPRWSSTAGRLPTPPAARRAPVPRPRHGVRARADQPLRRGPDPSTERYVGRIDGGIGPLLRRPCPVSSQAWASSPTVRLSTNRPRASGAGKPSSA